MALAFVKAGFDVTGIDIDPRKIGQLSRGLSYISDVTPSEIDAALKTQRFRVSTEYAAATLADRDVVLICAPVQLTPTRTQDTTQLRQATEQLQPHVRAGLFIVVHSATPPGTTRTLIQPILQRDGLQAGRDFDLVCAPERADMGRFTPAVSNIPRVVGGASAQSTARAMRLFAALGAAVHIVSSLDVAEVSVMLENVSRAVNIALVNEMALLCERMGVDIWEAVNAAQSKPFGFTPFTPGPGVGGHRVAVDPYLLAETAHAYDLHLQTVEAAAEVNLSMPFHAVELLDQALSQARIPMKSARIIVVGVAYKRDVEDTTHAPARRIIETLIKRGAEVSYYDPYVPRLDVGGNYYLPTKHSLVSTNLSESNLERAHGVVIVTGHHAVDYANIVRYSRAVVDCCNATRGVTGAENKVVRLGA